MMVVDGPCVFGSKCVGYSDTGPIETFRSPVCAPDRHRINTALDELPALYVGLMGLYTEPRSASAVRGGTRVHPGLPIRPEVDALMRETVLVLASWDEVVRDAARLSRLLGDDKCRTLRRHLDTFLRLPETTVARHVDASQVANLPDDTDGVVMANGDAVITRDLTGVEGALEIIDLQRRVRGMLGQTRRVRRIDVVTCPRCDLLSLTQPEGSKYIECGDAACGTLLTRDEYAERVREALKDAREELAAVQADDEREAA